MEIDFEPGWLCVCLLQRPGNAPLWQISVGGLSLCRTKTAEHRAFVRRRNTRTKAERLRAVWARPIPFGFLQAAPGFDDEDSPHCSHVAARHDPKRALIQSCVPDAGRPNRIFHFRARSRVRDVWKVSHTWMCSARIGPNMPVSDCTAVLAKTSHANCCTTLTIRPLRLPAGRFVRVRGFWEIGCKSIRARVTRSLQYCQNWSTWLGRDWNVAFPLASTLKCTVHASLRQSLRHNATYSRSPKNPALQLLQKSSKSATAVS